MSYGKTLEKLGVIDLNMDHLSFQEANAIKKAADIVNAGTDVAVSGLVFETRRGSLCNHIVGDAAYIPQNLASKFLKTQENSETLLRGLVVAANLKGEAERFIQINSMLLTDSFSQKKVFMDAITDSVLSGQPMVLSECDGYALQHIETLNEYMSKDLEVLSQQH